MTIAWFSCGVTSAVACKIALNSYPDTRLYYIDTGSQQEDSMRFLLECEKWYGKEITVLRNEEYRDHFEGIQRQEVICSNRAFYPCSYELKKKVRYRLEDELKHWDGQVFGFDTSEKLRARRFTEQNPNAKPLFPLIEHNLSKENAAFILHRAGIELPRQYRLGYRNNNCIGCVRGGMGY